MALSPQFLDEVRARVSFSSLAGGAVKLVKAGRLNEELIDLIRANVRVDEQVIGDIMANVSATEVGCKRLVEFLGEYGIPDLDALTDRILDQSERAMRDRIREANATRAVF